jgi:vancomycin resistance protein YoaR
MRRHRTIKIIIVAAALLFFAGEIAYFVWARPVITADVEAFREMAYPNKAVNGVDVSGMTAEEISEVIEEVKQEYLKKQITLHLGNGRSYSFTMADFGPRFEQSGIAAARIVGEDKELPYLLQYLMLKGVYQATPVYINLRGDYDRESVAPLAERIAGECCQEKCPPQFSVENDQICLTSGKDGYSIDAGEIADALLSALEESAGTDSISVELAGTADPLSQKERMLETINSCISEFTTEYKAKSAKATNVENASAKIDNLILYPGESLSVDRAIQERTRANGYVYAPQFDNGRVVEGMGGGICQVCTTLYGALLRAGIIPIERHPHSMVVTYVPIGLDAAIAKGYKDLVFENTLDYPICITAKAGGGKVTFKLWSNENALDGYRYEPASVRISSKRSESYLKKYLGEELVDTIRLSRDSYR